MKKKKRYQDIIIYYCHVLAKRCFGINTVKYLFVKFAKTPQKIMVNPNLTYLMTFDEKKIEEEVFEGWELMLMHNQKDTLKFSDRIGIVKKYLELQRFPQHLIENVTDELIRQEIFKKFIQYTDNHNGNWAIAVDGKMVRAFPAYDFDLCCGVNYKVKDGIKETYADNGKTDLKSLIMQYKDLPWMESYINEVLKNMDMQNVFSVSKEKTGIKIPEDVKEWYTNYFEQRLGELQTIYKEIYLDEKDKEEEK